ncbi:restriction endonuclease subunit S [Planktothrix agardhii]|uniref:restriction endonuclease subunit S n=1 Tax=Planktothrix agardhii TaxID=1160 RepID=UPI001D0AC6DC|nr:restriction endonuclease subunit S [Planktothrix agardhii]MCB8787842.1 restriction endonuclease subunit S [Planktothrix agardhii 1025]MCF3610390.1 restriction endonuclease subunit S [Planktothrix agardhii 1027]MCF3643988.1 restriction endonuclease subunit S [Planktothrix agardhii 1026]
MNLPKGWIEQKFSDVAKVVTGNTPKTFDVDNYGGDLPFITPSELKSSEAIINTPITISKKGETQARIIPENAVLVCCIGSLGKVGITGRKSAFNQQINALIFDSEQVYYRYGYHYCRTLKPILEHFAPSTTVPIVNKGKFQEFKIPIPPIASQRTIANILDKADEIIRKRKEAIALTEQLQKSIFLDMFGDPVINPKGWEVNKVIDYCDCIVPGRDKPKSFTGSIPWITTADLKFLDKTYFSNLNMKLSENEIKEVNAKIIPKNSVLLTCVGDLGVTSIAGCDMVVNQQLHSFQCKNINNYFLMYALPYQKIFMYKRATQTTVPYMNKNTCNSIPIIYPPRKLQEKFGILIAEINNKKGLYLKALQESENLFNSLLQKAFKGEL